MLFNNRDKNKSKIDLEKVSALLIHAAKID